MCDFCSGKRYGLFVGTVLIILGTAILCFPPKTLKRFEKVNLVLKKGSENYENWVQNSAARYTQFTLFNWTNAHIFYIQNARIKPNFVEMGPYVFRQQFKKENIKFYKTSTVSYNEKKTWFFEPEMSNGNLNDMVTSPHIVTAGLINSFMLEEDKYKRELIKYMINNYGGKLATTQNVSSWIFNGYDDLLLDKFRNPSLIKDSPNASKFGYYFGRNNSATYDGEFSINTGAKNLNNLGMLTHWNRMTNNGFYNGECGKVNGSAGDIFPPKLNDSDLTIYSTDVCRFLNLVPDEKVEYKDELDAFKWIGTAETLDSGIINSNKDCFAGDKSVIFGELPMKGVADCRKCHNDWPIYASFPHFYLADKKFVKNVTGLSPVKDKHQYSYVLKMQSGLPLEIKARIQMNLLIRKCKHFEIYKYIPKKTLIPLYFVEDIGEFGYEKAISRPCSGYILIILGSIINIVFIILIQVKCQFEIYESQLDLRINMQM